MRPEPITTSPGLRRGFIVVAVGALLSTGVDHTAARPDPRIDAEMCHAGTGNLDIDRSICERAARAYEGPTRAALLARKAGAEIWLGKYHKALKDVDAALQAFSGSSLAYFERGRAYRRLGRLEDSVRAYDEAINLWPRFTVAFRERGLSKLLNGQFTEAEADLSRSIELAPSSPEAWVVRGIGRYLKSALSVRNASQWPQHVEAAAEDFEQAAELLYPYRYLPLWRYVADGREKSDIDKEGQLLPDEWPVEIGQHLNGQLALEEAEAIAQQSPFSARRLGYLYWFLGLSAARQNNFGEAEDWFAKAAEAAPEDTTIHQLAALLFRRTSLR